MCNIIKNVHELPDLQAMIDGGYITVRKHPSEELYIYNYTSKAQYEPMWNEATMTCRGLITKEDGSVVARPFVKFFNIEQVESLPDEPYTIYEKYDGSLGIMYFVEGRPYIATRGSFDSPQAKVANEMLEESMTGDEGLSIFDPDYTYLFEIIHPSTKVVVDYNNQRMLVLLAIVHTKNGEEVFPSYGNALWLRAMMHYHIRMAERHGVFTIEDTIIEEIVIEDIMNRIKKTAGEGIVIRYQSGLRIKMKTDDYVRLHKLVCGISEKAIWEILSTGKSIDELLGRVPDEFYQWVHAIASVMQAEYAKIEAQSLLELAGVLCELGEKPPRKIIAEKIMQFPNKAILFAMLDAKDYGPIIWKAIKPNGNRTFRVDDGS